MAKRSYYVPRISRFLICTLYHESQRRGSPMTHLVDELLTEALQGTPGWSQAEEQLDRENASGAENIGIGPLADRTR